MPRAYISIIEISHVVASVHSSRSSLTRRMQELLHNANTTFLKALCAATDSQISVYLNNQLKNKKQAHQQNAALALCSGLLAII